MISDIIAVSSRGEEFDAALVQAEKVAAYKDLSAKNALQLRLLTEEMMGMMRSITGQTDGRFWIEAEDGTYRLHLKARSFLEIDKRKKLIAASTSGKNEASKGLMGRLRAFFEPDDDTPAVPFLYLPESLGDIHDSITWSMIEYREALEADRQNQCVGAEEAWDELEKSVVTHVADEILVRVEHGEAELTIIKKMN